MDDFSRNVKNKYNFSRKCFLYYVLSLKESKTFKIFRCGEKTQSCHLLLSSSNLQ